MDSMEQYEKIIQDFFKVFSSSVQNTLVKSLDEDVCTNIELKLASTTKTNDPEPLKEEGAIYRLDFAINDCQGTLAIIIPEELIAVISDILTGGNGEKAYKGSISEIEKNSILNILEKTFKNIETDFKKNYEYSIVFSSTPVLLFKDKPNYQVTTNDVSFDVFINTILNLNDEIKHNIKLLISTNFLSNLVKELGLSPGNTVLKQKSNSQVSIENLSDVKINITAELGRTRVPIKYALELVRGSLVELDTVNNSDIKVFANGVEFAQAQVVAVQENFGLKITKIIPPEERVEEI